MYSVNTPGRLRSRPVRRRVSCRSPRTWHPGSRSGRRRGLGRFSRFLVPGWVLSCTGGGDRAGVTDIHIGGARLPSGHVCAPSGSRGSILLEDLQSSDLLPHNAHLKGLELRFYEPLSPQCSRSGRHIWRAGRTRSCPGQRSRIDPKKRVYSPFSIASIAAAARFAEPIASITVAAPVAMSPPA